MNDKDTDTVIFLSVTTTVITIFILLILYNILGYSLSFEKEETFFEFNCYGDCHDRMACDMMSPNIEEKYFTSWGCLEGNNYKLMLENLLEESGNCKTLRESDGLFNYLCTKRTNSWRLKPSLLTGESK